jgi:branched-chain amino acid transport system permease protein
MILAFGWDILGGQAGYVSFGNVVFFGISGYVSAVLLAKFGVSPVLSIVAGAVCTSIFAAVISYPIFRLKGHYFSIATLGLSLAVQQVIFNIKYVGAADGMSLPIIVYDDRIFYYCFLSIAVFSFMLIYYLRKVKIFDALNAIRDDEEKAASLGVPTTLLKMLGWSICAFISGLVGSLYALWFSYIEPKSAFSDVMSMSIVLVALLGGMGTLIGPVIGAVILFVIIEVVWTIFPGRHPTIIGLLIVLIVMFAPQGIVKYLKKHFSGQHYG